MPVIASMASSCQPVVKRLRSVSHRKQRRLLHLLSCLDRPPSASTPLHRPRPHVHKESSPGSASDQGLADPVCPKDGQPRSNPGGKSTVTVQEGGGASDGAQRAPAGLEVQLRILSNWGHAHLVGLTEVNTLGLVAWSSFMQP